MVFESHYLLVNHFYCPTNALNYTNLELKSTLYKSLRDRKLKNEKSLRHVSELM